MSAVLRPRPATPSEKLMMNILREEQEALEPPDCFNMAISRAAQRCGLPYTRVEYVSQRTILGNSFTFPSFKFRRAA